VPTLDVRVRFAATVEVEAGQENEARRRLQAALDAVVGPLEEMGATFDSDQEFTAQTREEEGSIA